MCDALFAKYFFLKILMQEIGIYRVPGVFAKDYLFVSEKDRTEFKLW